MLESYLIEHCSPTLAGIKAASLFNAPAPCMESLICEICDWNRSLSGKGVRLLLLRSLKGHALIYVYRPALLTECLSRERTQAFLSGYGYEAFSCEEALARLKERFLASPCFPHEIGVFLDYPLEDVIGFIENAGQDYKCAGCWKVYHNEYEALALFCRYRACKKSYQAHFRQGMSIYELTVAA